MSTKALIVDDDTKLCGMLSEYLGGEGFVVSVLDRGTTLLERVRSFRPDVVLLDVMLPDANGFELCRAIRAESTVPVIMLTARGDETDRVVGLEIGADDYVPKPFSPRELVARIRAVLRRVESSAPPDGQGWLSFGELRIDLEGRRLEKSGRTLELTARQFDVLRVLVERRGRVQSRNNIHQAITGSDLDTFDRSIDVHISRIRALIEDDPKKPARLKSVRGAGYVFVAERA